MTEDRRITDAYGVKLDAIQDNVSEMKLVLKSLTESVNRLSVIEERQANGAAATERAFVALEKVDVRLIKLETSVPALEHSALSLKKLEERTKRLEEIAPDGKRASVWVDRSVFAVVGLAVATAAKKLGWL
jgi:hypothetical protein